jgi:hypothetical protein
MTFFAIVTLVKHGVGLTGLLGYIGPDVFLPLTSALAAVGGVLLMFWHKIAGFVARLLGRTGNQPAPPAVQSKSDRD